MHELGKIKIEQLFVGLPGDAMPELNMDVHGISEDQKHYGPTLIAGPRIRFGAPKLPAGQVDENWRKFSAISKNEVQEIREMYEDKYNRNFDKLDASYFGANLLMSGLENLSSLGNGVIFFFDVTGVCLLSLSENTACKNPGKIICRDFDIPVENAKEFVSFAKGRRGLVGTIIRGGCIRQGDEATVYKV